jgi:hypothetical protein
MGDRTSAAAAAVKETTSEEKEEETIERRAGDHNTGINSSEITQEPSTGDRLTSGFL